MKDINLKVISNWYVPFDYLILQCKAITVLFNVNFNCFLKKKTLKENIVASLLKFLKNTCYIFNPVNKSIRPNKNQHDIETA